MFSLRKNIRRFRKDDNGATVIEAAIVFPILIMCLFGFLGLGTYLFGTHQAQRTVEETAREARMINAPTESDLVALLDGNMKNSMFGEYTPKVRIISQFDGSYAELEIVYSFNFDFPLLDKLDLESKSSTQVKIRELPI